MPGMRYAGHSPALFLFSLAWRIVNELVITLVDLGENPDSAVEKVESDVEDTDDMIYDVSGRRVENRRTVSSLKEEEIKSDSGFFSEYKDFKSINIITI